MSYQSLKQSFTKFNEDGTAANRGTAVRHGLKTYFTGKFCRRGHRSRRYATNGACLVCLAQNRSAREARDQEAREMLVQGDLPKDIAEALDSVWYCEGELLDCGHIPWRRVVDGKCKMCLDKEEGLKEWEHKQQLDLAARLLS